MNNTGPGLLLVAVSYVGVRLIVGLLSEELRGWIPLICRLLVDAAARELPSQKQVRWRREWHAELAAKASRPLSALVYAFGIRRSARALAAELWDAEDADCSPLSNAFKRAQEVNSQYSDGYITSAELREALREPMRSLAGRNRIRFFIRWMPPAYALGVRHYFVWRRYYREQKQARKNP